MRGILQDVRCAIRGFSKSPGFAITAVATLALGIGANAAIFALVDRVLVRMLPVRAPEELALLRSPGPSQGHTWSDGDDDASFSYPMYRDLRDSNTVFSGLLAEYPFDANVTARSETERAAGELVSGNYFEVLGVVPSLGRTLSSQDDRIRGAHPVAVLSQSYWHRRFSGDPSVLNKAVIVNGQPLTVVGVARAGFAGIQPGRPADLFVPTMMKPQMTPFWNGLDDPKDYWIQLIGRLKPGVSRDRAETALLATYRPLLRALSPQMTGWDDLRRRQFESRRLVPEPGGRGRPVLRRGVGTPLLFLSAMVGIVLLIACSNLAGLLAARGAARQREYGIRLAIGASRPQLLRQSLIECLLFAFAGGALGLLVAGWSLHALLRAFPPDADLRQLAAHVDFRVLAFSAVVSVFAGLLFGITPALRAARLDPARTLRGGGRAGASAGRDVLRFRRWLVTGQVALTLVLLVAAGLFVRTLRNLGRVDLGLKPDHVIGFSIAPELNGYTAGRTAMLARDLTERLSALPGVRSVSAAELPTLANEHWGGNVFVEGSDPQRDSEHVGRNAMGPDYFSTLGIPLLSGRELSWRDDATAPPVAVINQTMARRFFPGRNPVGARIGFFADSRGPSIEIVGVARDSKSGNVMESERAFVYTPYLQDPKLGNLTFYLRSQQSPERLTSAIRSEVRRLDSTIPIFGPKTLHGQIEESLVTQRLLVLLSAAFGGLAAFLAALGVYGVLAFAVEQRRQEIGVRIALGADPAAVRRFVLAEVGGFLLVGSVVGLPAAYLLARAVESILFGVRAADVSVFSAGLALMAAVSLAAALPPTLQAARINVTDALRSE